MGHVLENGDESFQAVTVGRGEATENRGVHIEHRDHMQSATNRLRTIDIFSDTVDDLVEAGELGNNSLLPMACAKERQLELESVLALYKKKRTRNLLKKARKMYPSFKWRKSVRAAGLSEADFQRRFDEEMDALDGSLFGLDLTDAHAAFDW